jgi:exopolyphosphatase / guanosine-5'-triphosphate,3'-diphosphate pyrophosphatase
MLHDIGVAVNYDDHHRHSYYLTLNAGLPGFTPRELVLIGLVARYHRKGMPDASDLGDLAEAGDDSRLELLCGIIRLAEQLERSRDRAITDVRVSANGGGVSLGAEADPARDATVPIWEARRNADLLAEAVGRPVEIEIET